MKPLNSIQQRFLKFGLVAAVLFAGIGGYMAAPEGGAAGEPPFKSSVYPFKESGSASSTDFSVSNANFNYLFRRDGRGEVLEVSFDIANETFNDMDLEVAVIAFYETDRVDEKMRRFVPYPGWRSRDYEKEAKSIKHVFAAPVDIKDEDVWALVEKRINENEAFTADQKAAEMVNVKHDRDFKIRPALWNYLEYAQANHDKLAHKFTLSGNNVPKQAIEDLKGAGGNPPKQAILYHQPLKSTVFTYHDSLYRPNYVFFNRVMVVLFDPAQMDGAKGPRMVYRQFYEFTRKPKMR